MSMRAEIHDASEMGQEEMEAFSSRHESRLKHCREPEPGFFVAETPNVIMRALSAGYRLHAMLSDKKLLDNGAVEKVLGVAATGTLPVYLASEDGIAEIAGCRMTHGMLAIMERRSLPAQEELLQGKKRIAIMENVENPINLGAIFRSAAALSIDAVLLSPGCTDPLYRRAARVSMGTVFQVPWTYAGKRGGGWPAGGMGLLRREGFRSVAMALGGEDLDGIGGKLRSEEKLAILLGTEGEGLCDETLAQCDYSVRIPMSNGVDSLNVAAAAAVTFWELRPGRI